MESQLILIPAQQRAYDGLLAGIATGAVCTLRGDAGMGKSTILRKAHAATGGGLLSIKQFMEALTSREPAAIEEAFLGLVEQQLKTHELLYDDLSLLTDVTGSHRYPRPQLLDAVLTALLNAAGERKKQLVFGIEHYTPDPIRRRAYSWKIGEFSLEDYASLCGAFLNPETAVGLDYAKIHRYAPVLTAYQLKGCCGWLRNEPGVDTDRFIDCLSQQNLISNVSLDEVQPVDWKDLKGVDDVIEALEAKVALPFENDQLAAELNLKPKRGVLLAGPPGTGKTTIGRALAHRLKSKFFLIDGTVVAGSDDFYCKIQQIFESAKQNAPSVVFIDDADVIFEDDKERGLYRYLLTMLDGLESASAERVCVMMTAMNAGSLPQALLRSGRVELWLETKVPDTEAREAILRERLTELPRPLGAADAGVLASASQGLTGADLKAIIEDGKLLFAHDKARGKTLRDSEEYFIEAIGTVRANRRNYARSKPMKFSEVVKVGFGVE